MFTKTKTALFRLPWSLPLLTPLPWLGQAGKMTGTSGLGGFVIPGSTVGVNPAYHQDEFGSAAKAYGYAVSPSQKHRPSHDRR